MSTSHNHTKPVGCAHELKHCADCDVAYCTKCGKEWSSIDAQLERFKEYGGKDKYPGQRPRWMDDPNIVLCAHKDTAHG